MNTNTELDSFDQALLTELRQVAAEGAPTRVGRTRKRWAYAGTGVAAAAVTAIGLSYTVGSPSAYAVDEQGDGDIVITIHELDDADGLEQALSEHGIEADVDYSSQDMGGPVTTDGDPQDLKARWGGKGSGVELEVSDEPGADVRPDLAVPGELPDGDPCGGLDDMPFETTLTSDEFVITIPGDSVLRESDAVLRITTSGDVDEQMAGIDVAFSIGDVHCGFGTASVGTPTD